MSDDIVAELDGWLSAKTEWSVAACLRWETVQRAHDEIVALREWKNEHPYSEVDMEMGCNAAAAERIIEYQNIARANTLEEAAQTCETRHDASHTMTGKAMAANCAAAIRALRDA